MVLGALFIGALAFVISYWLLLDDFTPGNKPETVKNSSEAITRVNATHVTLFSVLGYAAYRVFGK